MLSILSSAVDTAIVAIPIAFAALVAAREVLKTRRTSTRPTPPPTPLAPAVQAPSVPTPAVATKPDVVTPDPHPSTQVEMIIATVRSAELRRYCTESGIRWRNAHGKGRHLNNEEMRRALLALGNLHLPWVV